MLLSVSSTVINAGGKVDAVKVIGTWIWSKRAWFFAGALTVPEIVSAAGYFDDEANPASDDINEAIKNCKHTYKFKFCTAQNGNEVAVAHSVPQCSNGTTPRNGITIDLSKLEESSCRKK
jgi:hypothetical protein